MTIRAPSKIHIGRLLGVLGLLSLLSAAGVSTGRAEGFPLLSGKFTFEGKPYVGTATLINTSVTNAALFLNGEYSTDYWGDGKPGGKGYTAVFRPSVFHYERFTAVVKLRPENISVGAILLAGGVSCRWFVLSSDQDGKVELSLNNRRFRHPIHNLTLTNGQWITLALTVDLQAKAIVVYANGTRVDELVLPEGFVLDVMNDEKWKEHDKVLTFTNYSYGGTFHGLVAGLLTFDTILTGDQLRQLFPEQ
jgi:hypothetical protein